MTQINRWSAAYLWVELCGSKINTTPLAFANLTTLSSNRKLFVTPWHCMCGQTGVSNAFVSVHCPMSTHVHMHIAVGHAEKTHSWAVYYPGQRPFWVTSPMIVGVIICEKVKPWFTVIRSECSLYPQITHSAISSSVKPGGNSFSIHESGRGCFP